MKPLPAPRLELLGAVLLTKLLTRVRGILGYNLVHAKAYCDSTIVLVWLKGPATKYETFVRNHIAFVVLTLHYGQWNHVTTDMNPADLLTRGIPVATLINNALWLYEPKLPDEHAKTKVELPSSLPEIWKR